MVTSAKTSPTVIRRTDVHTCMQELCEPLKEAVEDSSDERSALLQQKLTDMDRKAESEGRKDTEEYIRERQACESRGTAWNAVWSNMMRTVQLCRSSTVPCTPAAIRRASVAAVFQTIVRFACGHCSYPRPSTHVPHFGFCFSVYSTAPGELAVLRRRCRPCIDVNRRTWDL